MEFQNDEVTARRTGTNQQESDEQLKHDSSFHKMKSISIVKEHIYANAVFLFPSGTLWRTPPGTSRREG
ncbi:MAG TPA: hypothetical protein PLR43_03290 [Syntrophales bacterium]|nr:hypothetical protein [Syntrophales bacterium]